MNRSITIVALFSLVALSACGSAAARRTSIATGTLATPRVAIEAEDASFALKSGETFRPPFQATPLELATTSAGTIDPNAARGAWRDALENGAKKVTVTGADGTTLHGILFLTQPRSGKGPGASSYRIVVPESFVDAARRGSIAVLMEETELAEPVKGRTRDASWILWLSKDPFA